ncbi:1,5-anhydro-D-fructose reductase, partial [Merops nubicus]
VRDAVEFASDAGYHHFDCAYLNQDESEIGDALQEKIEEWVLRQEDLFIVTKVCFALPLLPWSTFQERSLVKEAYQEALAALQRDYLDLYLMHWSVGFKTGKELFPADGNGMIVPSGTDFLDTWE